MQTMVDLIAERQAGETDRKERIERRMVTPGQRSSPPPPPVPEPPTPRNWPEEQKAKFWTWFIENPRSARNE
jgi:hypothetical protein